MATKKSNPKAGVINWLIKMEMYDQEDREKIIQMFLDKYSEEYISMKIPIVADLTQIRFKFISDNWSRFCKFVASNTEFIDYE
jgi:hypothetical protein